MTDKHVCKYCGETYTCWLTHSRYCKPYIDLKNKELDLLTKEFLIEHYVNNEESCGFIAEKYNVNIKRVYSQLKKYNIHIRTSAETRHTKCYIERTKETCRKKFGADYAGSKGSNVFNKKVEAVIKKYGVDNIRKSDYFKEHCKKVCLDRYGYEHATQNPAIKEKVKQTNLKKYGVTTPSKLPEFINKCKRTRCKNSLGCYSSVTANKFFSCLLEKLNTNYKVYTAILGCEYSVMSDNKKLYCYDFVIPDLKKCIEFNGNYWHANPEIYNENWVHPLNKLTAKQIWKNDENKINTIKTKRNFDVLVIWEKDVTSNFNACIENCIKFLTK